MIRRFLYWSFWNFYDYLGTYFIVGATSTFLLLGCIAAAGQLVSSSGILFGLLSLFCWVLLSALMAGTFYFADKAARDLPARWPDIVTGIKQLSRRYAVCLLLIALGAVVTMANIAFYSSIARGVTGAAAIALTAFAAAFLWLGLGAACYALVLLATAAGLPGNSTYREVLRRSFMSLALTPGLWLFLLFGFTLFTLGCIWSRIGIIFILPFVACGATTARRLVEQYAEHLAEAHTTLGPGKPLSAYKAKAREAGLAWEYRQPRRTLREMIKPWEY